MEEATKVAEVKQQQMQLEKLQQPHLPQRQPRLQPLTHLRP